MAFLCLILCIVLCSMYPIYPLKKLITNDRLIIETEQRCKSTTPPKPDKVRRINNIWQIVEDSGSQILIFGAYFDSRPNVYKHTVRLFTVTTFKPSKYVYCQLWYKNDTRPQVLRAVPKDIGRGLSVSGTLYQERMYSCELESQQSVLPLDVSLSFSECSNSTTLVSIIVPPVKETYEFGVCVVVAYGELDPVALSEWIEFNRLLGVGEINVYNSRLNVESMRIFQHYKQLGVVNIRESAPPLNNWCKWCQKLTAIPALNDCMYRNMFRYKYLAVIDFDEFIIPKISMKWSSMISYLQSTWKEDPPSFMFRNGYFFEEFPVNRSNPSYLLTSRNLHRTEPSRAGYAVKSIVNPRRCVSMQNHYCMIRTADVMSYALQVSPEIALVHHYKPCHFSKSECNNYLMHPVLDKSALRFLRSLNATIYKRLQELKLVT